MVLLVLAVLVVVALCVVAGAVWREWHLYHGTRAYRDRQATLEGGGSHLSRSARTGKD